MTENGENGRESERLQVKWVGLVQELHLDSRRVHEEAVDTNKWMKN